MSSVTALRSSFALKTELLTWARFGQRFQEAVLDVFVEEQAPLLRGELSLEERLVVLLGEEDPLSPVEVEDPGHPELVPPWGSDAAGSVRDPGSEVLVDPSSVRP